MKISMMLRIGRIGRIDRLQKDSPGPEHVKNDLGNSKQINIDCLICLSCLYFFLFFFRFSTPSSR